MPEVFNKFTPEAWLWLFIHIQSTSMVLNFVFTTWMLILASVVHGLVIGHLVCIWAGEYDDR